MSLSLERGVTPRDVFGAISRHRGKAIAFFVAVTAATLVAIFVLPKKYRSEAKLYIKPGVMPVDPTVQPNLALPQFATQEVEVNSTLELLNSRGLAEKVVEDLGPAKVLGADESELTDESKNLAIKTLQESMYIVSPRKTTVIVIEAKAATPALAQEIVSSYMTIFYEEQTSSLRTGASLDFFAAQQSQAEEDWQNSVAILRDAKNEIGVASLDQRRAILHDQLGEIENQRIVTAANLAASNDRLKSLSVAMDSLPERSVSEVVEGVLNGADYMRQNLYELRLRETQLLATRSATHPEVRAIRDQVERASKALEELAPERSTSTSVAHPARAKIEVEKLNESANYESLLARQSSLDDQYKTAQKELKDFNHFEIQIKQLERKVEQDEANYRNYTTQLEQAKMHQALEKQRLSNIAVSEQPTLETKAVSPNKWLIMAFGLGVAFFGALTIAVAAEFLDSSVKSAEDIERELNLPVMLTVPRLPESSVVAN